MYIRCKHLYPNVNTYHTTIRIRSTHLCTVDKMMHASIFNSTQKIEKPKIMNSLKNKVNLIGNLGFNPEIKTFDDGKKLAKVTLATNESYRNQKGDRVDDTQWHNLVAWGKTAELLQKYTKVGSKIAVEGKLVNRSYQDKGGQKKYVTEIQVSEILLLDQWNGGQQEH